MPDRTRLMKALETMPDEAFGYLVLATATPPFQGVAGFWPDGIGGFTDASKASITEAREAAREYMTAAESATLIEPA